MSEDKVGFLSETQHTVLDICACCSVELRDHPHAGSHAADARLLIAHRTPRCLYAIYMLPTSHL